MLAGSIRRSANGAEFRGKRHFFAGVFGVIYPDPSAVLAFEICRLASPEVPALAFGQGEKLAFETGPIVQRHHP